MDKKIIIFFFLFLLTSITYAQEKKFSTVNDYMINHPEFEEIIYVSINEQKLFHMTSEEIIQSYSISSSKYGIGNKQGSNKTPLGLHKIKEKHGKKTPKNGRMIGRVFYGEIAKIFQDKSISETDDVTSRVLWLEGIEKGINKGDGIDSYKRYIYIHGTSEEGWIGQPASHGCIRMKNKDVIDLFKEVSIGTFVLIL
jgi:hypothetical protein